MKYVGKTPRRTERGRVKLFEVWSPCSPPRLRLDRGGVFRENVQRSRRGKAIGVVPQHAISMYFTSSGDNWVGVARWGAHARERRRVSRIRRRRAARHRVASHRRSNRRGGVATCGQRTKMFRCVHFHMQLRHRNDGVSNDGHKLSTSAIFGITRVIGSTFLYSDAV